MDTHLILPLIILIRDNIFQIFGEPIKYLTAEDVLQVIGAVAGNELRQRTPRHRAHILSR